MYKGEYGVSRISGNEERISGIRGFNNFTQKIKTGKTEIDPTFLPSLIAGQITHPTNEGRCAGSF